MPQTRHVVAGPADRLYARRRMILYPGFLDKARCEHVIKMAKARLRPSSLALRKTDTADKIRCAAAGCLRALGGAAGTRIAVLVDELISSLGSPC